MKRLALVLAALVAVASGELDAAPATGESSPPPKLESLKSTGEYACPMHPEVRADRPGERCHICGMELVKGDAAEAEPVATTAPEPQATPGEPEAAAPAGFSRSPIRLNATQRQAIGLTYGVAERRKLEKVIRTVGRFDYDERRLAEVSLKISGWIHELFADFTGKAVRKGDPLFSIYSPDLVTAQQEYLLALQTEDRLRASKVPGAAESASDLARTSRERLRLWDLGDREIRELRESRKPKLNQTFYAPMSGVVIEKMALRGSRVEPGMMLYKIADLSTLWVYADVYESEVPFVQVGQEAKITVSYIPDQTFTARVAYVYPTLDAKARTVKVRFELPNTENPQLRPEMFGKVDLKVPAGERLVVPRDALLDSGQRQVVFVDEGQGRLSPRDVRVGSRFDDWIEVTDGLKAGERVVTSANFLVDSESKLQAAESMMGMMGAIGMGDWKMESARPMDMGGGEGEAAEREGHAPESERAAAPDEKRVGEFMVAVFPAKGQATATSTPIHVRVHDASGKPVTGAQVRFSYTMDMPGMSIEQAAAKELGEGLYEGMAGFTMAGPWGLVVEIAAPGKSPARAKFTIRVAG